MSVKRTSDEFSDYKRATEDPDAESKNMDNVKREKLASFSYTTLQDLPTEMLECIMINAIVMEVKDLRLAKSAWKEKADLVISRLETVCSHWKSILTTNSFGNKLHKALDCTAPRTIRLEVVHQSSIPHVILEATTLKDEIVLFCRQSDDKNDRSLTSVSFYDLSNLTDVKDVVQLRGGCPWRIVACNVSNCVYVHDQNGEFFYSSILCITRDSERQSNIETWIDDLSYSISLMSVSPKGNLAIISAPDSAQSEVSIYSPNAVLEHDVMLSEATYVPGFLFVKTVVEKSNGNLVLAYATQQYRTVIAEIGVDGTVRRRYEPPIFGCIDVNLADAFGRIVTNDDEHGIRLLDSELNLLDFTGPPKDHADPYRRHGLHYDSERNEVMGTRVVNDGTAVLTFFRFREE